MSDLIFVSKVQHSKSSSVIREITREAGDEPEQLQTNELFQDDKMGRRRIAEEARIKESEESNFIRINRKKGDR